MNPDISKILDQWPYESGRILARLVQGDHGESRVQVRLDLGLIQMNADGRPDGQRPFGFESLLDYFESQSINLGDTAGHGSPPPPPRELGESIAGGRESDSLGSEDRDSEAQDPSETIFRLTPDDCRMLREEAAQYYQRYLALLTLEDFERVIRDTTRNLRVLDICQRHAAKDEDRTVLEQFRPYITLAKTRALAALAMKENEPRAALFSLDEGLEAMRKHFAESGQPQSFDESEEVKMLKQMRESLLPRVPVSQKVELRTRLARALEQENYELAAILRDELRQLKDEGSPRN